MGHPARTLRLVLGVACFVAGTVFALADVAAADNCQQLIDDLGVLEAIQDELTVEDCLRTGGAWGRTVGTVVAVTGLGVAVGGMTRLRTKDPNIPADQIAESDNPCVGAHQWKGRLDKLDEAKKRLERMMWQEFKSYAAEAERLAHHYESIRAGWGRAKLARLRAGIVTIGGYGALAAAGVGFGGAMGASTAGAGGMALLPQAGALGGKLAAAAGLGMTAVGPYSVPPTSAFLADHWGVDFELRFWPASAGAKEEMQIATDLAKTMNRYMKEAATLNRNWYQWGQERQTDLDNLHSQFNDAFDRAKSLYEECRRRRAKAGGWTTEFGANWDNWRGNMPTQLKPYEGLIEKAQIHVGQLPLDYAELSDPEYMYWGNIPGLRHLGEDSYLGDISPIDEFQRWLRTSGKPGQTSGAWRGTKPWERGFGG